MSAHHDASEPFQVVQLRYFSVAEMLGWHCTLPFHRQQRSQLYTAIPQKAENTIARCHFMVSYQWVTEMPGHECALPFQETERTQLHAAIS
eukprot:1161728-Pelagomonas_calceolata.AAC.1